MAHLTARSLPAKRAAAAVAASAAALLLAACGSLPTPAAAPALFDFGTLAPLAPANAAQDAATARVPLQLAKVTAQGLPTNSQPVLYRFDYIDDLELRAYQNARWSRPVEQLVAQQLRRQLQQHGAVIEEDISAARLRESGELPPVLHVDVEQFEQRFTAAASSEGVVRLRATLMAPGARGDRLLGQHSFAQTAAANSADAQGGTQALAQAAQAAAAQVDAWVAQLLAR